MDRAGQRGGMQLFRGHWDHLVLDLECMCVYEILVSAVPEHNLKKWNFSGTLSLICNLMASEIPG